MNMVIFVLAVFLQTYLCFEGTNGCPAGTTGPDCKTACSPHCVDHRCHLLPSGSTNCTLGCTAGRHGTSCTLQCSHRCRHCERYDGDVCTDPKSTADPKDADQDGALNSRILVIVITSLAVFAGVCVVIIFLLVYRHCKAKRRPPPAGSGEEERIKRLQRKLPPLPPRQCGKVKDTAPHNYHEVEEALAVTLNKGDQTDHVYDLDFPEQSSDTSSNSMTHIQMDVLVSPKRNTENRSQKGRGDWHTRSVERAKEDHSSISDCHSEHSS
ncbi:uncharacterized protein [Haliotis asinina]|uniref:uncharacterized protein n=1 Tax=Haliotis asinina TaxID=109174 RepID=UPI003531F0D1